MPDPVDAFIGVLSCGIYYELPSTVPRQLDPEATRQKQTCHLEWWIVAVNLTGRRITLEANFSASGYICEEWLKGRGPRGEVEAEGA